MKVQLNKGDIFGKWIILKDLGTRLVGSRKRRFVLCRCTCEDQTTREVSFDNIKSGKSICCGCIGNKKTTIRNTKHGLIADHKRAFNAWNAAVQRCHNINNPGYDNYGGRGIRVCTRWRNSFENFLKDMGDPPKGHEIDRYPDNDGDYRPSNCRWASRIENSNNKRKTIYIEYKGITKPLAEWSRELGIKHNVLERRIKNGWTTEKAFTT